jgi:hypothetical protein
MLGLELNEKRQRVDLCISTSPAVEGTSCMVVRVIITGGFLFFNFSFF